MGLDQSIMGVGGNALHQGLPIRIYQVVLTIGWVLTRVPCRPRSPWNPRGPGGPGGPALPATPGGPCRRRGKGY